MSRRTRPILVDERGITLVMALLVMATLAVSATALIAYSSGAFRSSAYQRASETALPAAEAGISEALARLANAANPRNAALLPATTVSLEGSSITYSGAYDATTDRWTLTSTATRANPAGGTAPVTRTVTQDFDVSGGLELVESPAWQYLFTSSPSGCTTFSSSTEVYQPIYVTGDLCMVQSSKVLPAAQLVQVGGKVTMTSSALLGTGAATRIPTLRIGGSGCRYGIDYGLAGAYTWPCTTAQRVYATNQIHTVQAISKPPVDMAYWYENAKPGPKQGCTSQTGTPPVFDNNTTLDQSAGSVNFLPNASYSCIVTVGGVTVGQLSWNDATDTLTINGVVYIDGDVWINASHKGNLVGRGVMYVSGQIYFDGSFQICGARNAGNCDWNTWNPETTMIVFVAGSTAGEVNSVYLDSSVQIQGAFYSVNDHYQSSSVKTQGPVIARQLFYGSSTGSMMRPFTTLPFGTPSTPVSVVPVPGTWRES